MSPEDEVTAPPVELQAMTADELLDGAAAAIERFGWVQRVMGNTGVGFCLHGALDYAYWAGFPSGKPCNQEAEKEAYGALRSVIGSRFIGWNDSADRTKEEVVAALRSAAERSRTSPQGDPAPPSE